MACFLVPTAEAIVSTVATKAIQEKEKKEGLTSECQEITDDKGVRTPFSHKLKWLNNMLWGGSLLLAFEHVWHGEVVPWFPFLTAASNPSDAASMLHEMSTVGVTMAVLVTAVWIGMVAVSNVIEKRPQTDIQTSEEGA
ncbi:MAG: hypothetical protein ACI4S2_14570 [Lachnospiraceae bacterium]